LQNEIKNADLVSTIIVAAVATYLSVITRSSHNYSSVY